MQFTVNGQKRRFDDDPEMLLLWYLRDELNLVGTKFGCGIASCGACTVHLNGGATRSCSVPMEALAGASVTTIKGLAKGGKLHPVQQAWIEEDVAQWPALTNALHAATGKRVRKLPIGEQLT